jgi:hypothetical protein
MLHPKLSDDATLVQGRNDEGKRVKVNSVGGALQDLMGTVLAGPYTYPYIHEFKVKLDKKNQYGKEKVKKVSEARVSVPNWLVALDNGMLLSFAASELTF